MRRRWLFLLALCACGESARPISYAQYHPSVDSETWCRLGAGVFAFVTRPQVGPPLVGAGCTAPSFYRAPEKAPEGSTFAELVVEPGGAVEIPVRLPKVLQGAGCQLDSVVIPHGRRTADLAIEIASEGRQVPIVAYQQIPPPPENGVWSRSTVSDGSSRRRAIWSPDAPRPTGSPVVSAEPDLWPTGAQLRFDGGQTADGAASVVFEIEPPPPEPTPPPPEPTPPAADPAPAGPLPQAPSADAAPSPSPSESPPRAEAPPAGGAPPPDGAEPAEPAAPARPQPAPLVLVAYRHPIGIPAPGAFSIVLRARELPFGIGVRSDRESTDPHLSYRAPGAAVPAATHLVPQLAIIVTRCGRSVDEILRDVQ